MMDIQGTGVYLYGSTNYEHNNSYKYNGEYMRNQVNRDYNGCLSDDYDNDDQDYSDWD